LEVTDPGEARRAKQVLEWAGSQVKKFEDRRDRHIKMRLEK
jgi:hypothetical protein